MRDRYVRPPVPGRNTNLIGKVVDTEDRSAFVAPGNNQRAGYSGQWFRHDLDQKRFPFAGDWRDIDFTIADKVVDNFALSNRANDDHARTKIVPVVGNGGYAIGDAFDVFLQIAYGANHAGMILGVNEEGCCRVLRYNFEIARMISTIDVALLANCESAERRAQQADGCEYDSETHAPYHNVSGILRQASEAAPTFGRLIGR